MKTYTPEMRSIPLTQLDCPRRIKEDVCLNGAIILQAFWKSEVTGSCSENRERGVCPRGMA